MVPWHVIFGCRACPYAPPAVWSTAEWTTLQWWSGKGKEQDDEGKGKRRGSTGHEYHHWDDEGKGNRTWRGHMRETIYWGTPMGKGNEQDERNAEWLWRRNLLGNREDNYEVVSEWPQPSPPGAPPGHQGKGKGTSSSSSSWTSAGRHGKGKGKGNGKGRGKDRGKGKGNGKEHEEMSDSDDSADSQRFVDWVMEKRDRQGLRRIG